MTISRPVSVAISLFTLALLTLGLTACDSGGGANSEPEEVGVTVEGTVTGQESGNPIEGAEVTASPADEDNALGNATTGGDGGYELSFTVSEAETPAQIQLGVDAEGFVSNQVTVEFSPEISRDISLEGATMEASASGTITDAVSGDPVEGATVTGTRSGNEDVLFETTTSSDGTYVDSFEVAGEPSEVAIESAADGYETTKSTATFSEEISVDLSLPVTSTVSGTITRTDTGDPIEGATLTGKRNGTDNTLFEATTGSDGAYEASYGVSDKIDQITITTEAQDYEGSDETVQYSEGVTFDLGLTPAEINISVDGTVTSEEDGSGIESAVVEIFRTDDESLLSDATTSSDGSYEISSAVKAPDAPEEFRIKISEALGYEDKEMVIGFNSSINEDFALATAPIEISSVEDLQKIGEEKKYPIDGGYILSTDIDASGTEAINNGRGFDPIGDDDVPFDGTFDGNGFKISNLTIDRPSEFEVGLFGDVEQGKVMNLTLSQVSITGSSTVGGITGELGEFGSSTNPGEVIGVEVSGTVQGASTGISFDPSTTGGIVGSNQSGGEIRRSSFQGSVIGTATAGGVAGYNQGIVKKSSSAGDVKPNQGTTGSRLGGIVGWNRFSGTIEESQTSSNVSGGENTGGLTGENEGAVSKSYSVGNVSGTQQVGGLAGINDEGDISESYATGDVSGSSDVAGLIGVNGGTLSSSYWDTESTGQGEGIGRGDFNGATGLTTDQMQGGSAEENMGGFDFQNIWQSVTGDYPILSWEN